MNTKKIEKKWQDIWFNKNVFKAIDNSEKEKLYLLVEFPYPSGSFMHIGHVKAYIGLEVIARKRRLEGYNVLFPIGFDAFGLPTENYAMKAKISPREVTDTNIKTFTEQLKSVGFSFNYDRMIDTTDEEYYKWTQWIFLKMFDNDLVFRDKTMVNYCPSCKVVLSNEDSQGGKCDICKSEITQKEKDVWYLRITKYADRLLEGLKEVDYLPNIKLQQENWIGKSVGANIDFKVEGTNESLKVFTTRPDTLYGATFMVISPEHPLIIKYKSKITNIEEINNYQKEALKKTAFERVELNKDKTGVRIEGIEAINPINDTKIPIFVADYVMMNYGTGAIMGVPAHDERDYEFAKNFNLEIIEVIKGGDISKEAYTGDGEYVNSPLLEGIKTKEEGISKTINYLEEKGLGVKKTEYKMQDWAFNRQRYWGEPIPLIHCPKCGCVGVPYEELPLKLPKVDKIEVGEDGESPLSKIEEFVNCKCPKCGGPAKRETDTMPQWAGSSWYFLRYIDPFNDEALADPEKLKYWMNIDWYNGGMEHVTRHVIYSRFWHMFLYDIGVVPTKEPYAKRTAQGLILGSDGEKMSKSRGNVVNFDETIKDYGADTLRTYVLFMGEYGAECPWSEDSIKGVSRFLERTYNLKDRLNNEKGYSKDIENIIHRTIKKVSEDYEAMKYNTAIAELMKLLNVYYDKETITKKDYETFLTLLYPCAPHITEEANELIGNSPLYKTSWPKYDKDKIIEEEKTIGVQVNGKLRATIKINIHDEEEAIKNKALEEENVKKHIEGKEIIKIIVIQGKIVNIVVK